MSLLLIFGNIFSFAFNFFYPHSVRGFEYFSICFINHAKFKIFGETDVFILISCWQDKKHKDWYLIIFNKALKKRKQ